jgi:hypothetical protein
MTLVVIHFKIKGKMLLRFLHEGPVNPSVFLIKKVFLLAYCFVVRYGNGGVMAMYITLSFASPLT